MLEKTRFYYTQDRRLLYLIVGGFSIYFLHMEFELIHTGPSIF